MMDHLEARVFQRPWANDFAVFVRNRAPEGWALGRSITFEPMQEGAYEPNPTFSLGREQAQTLMDELWSAGLRPTQGRQSEGVTAAQARHLEDMRALAFAKLNVEKPTSEPSRGSMR